MSNAHIMETGNMHTFRSIFLTVLALSFLLSLAACTPSVSGQTNSQKQVTIDKGFQSQISPIPTVPPYRCGAWSSNNAPDPNSTITIYARITKDIAPIVGANATAVVHFTSSDQQIDSQATSDSGGYVSFTLQLQGQQPSHVPATVNVTFTNIPEGHGPLHCTPAFFTPQ
jgi:hypothetical protein